MNDEKQIEKRADLDGRTYVLTPADYAWDDADEVSLADYARVLWDRKALIAGVTLLCAAAALFISLLLPKVYEATATLIVLPPQFATELRPEPLSVETYQAIAESDYIKVQTQERLRREGALEPEENLNRNGMTADVDPGERAQEVVRPVIELKAQADDPEKAALIANTWAEIFVEESGGLRTRGQEGTIEFIEQEYPVTRERLQESETRLKEVQDRFDRQILQTETAWDERIAEFRATWPLESMTQELNALRDTLTENVVESNGLELSIKRTRDQLEQLQKEIEKHPQFLVLSKSITDDALWDQVGRDTSGELAEKLQSLKLRTEELNPVYRKLVDQLAETHVRYETLVPQQEHLRNQIAALKQETEALNRTILEKRLELSKMERQKETELVLLQRDRDFQVNGLEREVETSRETFKVLSEQYEAARLARAEADQDVKIGAAAIVPTGPVKPNVKLNTALALVVGFMMSIFLAFVVEFVSNNFGDAGSKRGG